MFVSRIDGTETVPNMLAQGGVKDLAKPWAQDADECEVGSSTHMADFVKAASTQGLPLPPNRERATRAARHRRRQMPFACTAAVNGQEAVAFLLS